MYCFYLYAVHGVYIIRYLSEMQLHNLPLKIFDNNTKLQYL